MDKENDPSNTPTDAHSTTGSKKSSSDANLKDLAMDTLDEAAAKIKDVFKGGLQQANTAFKGKIQEAEEFLDQRKGELKEKAGELADEAQKKLEAAKEKAGATAKVQFEKAKEAADATVKDAEDLANQAKDKAMKVKDDAEQALAGLTGKGPKK